MTLLSLYENCRDNAPHFDVSIKINYRRNKLSLVAGGNEVAEGQTQDLQEKWYLLIIRFIRRNKQLNAEIMIDVI